jgi:hypothetical protein
MIGNLMIFVCIVIFSLLTATALIVTPEDDDSH